MSAPTSPPSAEKALDKDGNLFSPRSKTGFINNSTMAYKSSIPLKEVKNNGVKDWLRSSHKTRFLGEIVKGIGQVYIIRTPKHFSNIFENDAVKEAQPAEVPVPAFILDSSEHKHLILLQMAPIPSSRLYKGICQLSGSFSTTPSSLEAYANEPTPSTFIIDTEGMPSKQLETLLDYIAGHKHLRLVYIRGEQPKSADERRTFFSRYRMIRGMDVNEERLIVQWAMDTANEYRKIGDALVKSGDKDKAQPCFVKGVALYENLSGFLKEKKAAK